MPLELQQVLLLTDATANTTGEEQNTSLGRGLTFYIEATGGSIAGTIDIAVKTPAGNWLTIDSAGVTSTDPIIIQDGDGAYLAVRAVLRDYSSGTFNVVATVSV